MRWTRDHIGSFGGNGSNLMIFGESAGGNSVINHLAQPDSFPLYNKAVVESGAYDTGAKTFDEGEKQYADLLKKTKCTDLDCLLAVDAAKILEAGSATQAASWAPTVDMVSLTAAPTELITRGQYNNQVSVRSDYDAAEVYEIRL
jgi:carboxylesterase type B